MKVRFKRMSGFQWFVVLSTGLFCSDVLKFEEAYQHGWVWVKPVKLLLSWMVCFLFFQWGAESNFIPVSLEMKLALAKPANKDDERLCGELDRVFKAQLKKGMLVRYTGFDLDGVTTWFHFTGADAEMIQTEVKRVLGGRSLPADAHFVIRTDWTTNEEKQVPLAA